MRWLKRNSDLWGEGVYYRYRIEPTGENVSWIGKNCNWLVNAYYGNNVSPETVYLPSHVYSGDGQSHYFKTKRKAREACEMFEVERETGEALEAL